MSAWHSLPHAHCRSPSLGQIMHVEIHTGVSHLLNNSEKKSPYQYRCPKLCFVYNASVTGLGTFWECAMNTRGESVFQTTQDK